MRCESKRRIFMAEIHIKINITTLVIEFKNKIEILKIPIKKLKIKY